jgi:hypothetical protein
MPVAAGLTQMLPLPCNGSRPRLSGSARHLSEAAKSGCQREKGAPVLSSHASRLKPEYHPGLPAPLLPLRSQGISGGAL